MSVALGWVVLDRRPGIDTEWNLDHSGATWESIDQAQAELDGQAAFDPDREYMLGRVIPAGDIVRVVQA